MDVVEKWREYTVRCPDDRRRDLSVLLERQAAELKEFYNKELPVCLGAVTKFIFPLVLRVFNDQVDWRLGDADRSNLVRIPINRERIEAIRLRDFYYGINKEIEELWEVADQVRAFLQEQGEPVFIGRRVFVCDFEDSDSFLWGLNIDMLAV